MSEELYELVLRIGTYDGGASYGSQKDLEQDFAADRSLALTPEDVRRLVHTAYEMGRFWKEP